MMDRDYLHISEILLILPAANRENKTFRKESAWRAEKSPGWVSGSRGYFNLFSCSPTKHRYLIFSSVQLVMSDSLRPHEWQHTRPPCPSPSPGVHSDSCPSSHWCHPATSSSVIPFFCPQSFPTSESFPVSQLFTWGDQSTGISALASFPPKKSQGWSPSEWTGWISLKSKGLSRVFSNSKCWLLALSQRSW